MQVFGQALEYFEKCVNVKKKHGVRSTEMFVHRSM